MQGKSIWILGFFSVLSGLTAIHAIVLWATLGIDGLFMAPLLDSLIGGIPVWIYLLIAIIATFIFFGATAVKLVTELSPKALLNEINAKVNNLESGQKLQQKFLESLQARVFLVDESLDAMRKEVTKAFGKQGEAIQEVQANLTTKVNTELASLKRDFTKQINGQREEIKKINANLANLFTKNLADTKEELVKQLGRMVTDMNSHERRSSRNEKAILKQMEELADIRLKVEQLGEAVTKMPEPQLTSQNKPEDVRGIGETTGKELREMEITNVGELVFTDPAVIAEKTGMSEKMVEKLQGRAQLAMVPGVTEKDMILLEEVGVMNRKDLANQDPLELGRKISKVFKVCVEEGKIAETEEPTIEEVYSWVKFAKA